MVDKALAPYKHEDLGKSALFVGTLYNPIPATSSLPLGSQIIDLPLFKLTLSLPITPY